MFVKNEQSFLQDMSDNIVNRFSWFCSA